MQVTYRWSVRHRVRRHVGVEAGVTFISTSKNLSPPISQSGRALLPIVLDVQASEQRFVRKPKGEMSTGRGHIRGEARRKRDRGAREGNHTRAATLTPKKQTKRCVKRRVYSVEVRGMRETQHLSVFFSIQCRQYTTVRNRRI